MTKSSPDFERQVEGVKFSAGVAAFLGLLFGLTWLIVRFASPETLSLIGLSAPDVGISELGNWSICFFGCAIYMYLLRRRVATTMRFALISWKEDWAFHGFGLGLLFIGGINWVSLLG